MIFPQCVPMDVLLAQILMVSVAGQQQRVMDSYINCFGVYYDDTIMIL